LLVDDKRVFEQFESTIDIPVAYGFGIECGIEEFGSEVAGLRRFSERSFDSAGRAAGTYYV
jgi:hypothetical protein